MTISDSVTPVDDADRARPAASVLDAERAVAGAALRGARNTDLLSDHVTVADFWDPEIATVFQACQELSGSGKPVDVLTVQHHLTSTGQVGMLRRSGLHILPALFADAPVSHPAALAEHARIVADDAHRRHFHAEAVRAATFTGSPEFTRTDTDTVLDRMQRAALYGRRGDAEALYIGDDIDETLDEIEHADRGATIPAPWTDVNDGLTLKPGQLVVVAARPGMGKSVAGLNLAAHVALNLGEGALFASLEMGRAEVQRRLLAAHARVQLHHLEHHTVDDREWAAIARVLPDIKTSPLLVDDATDTTPSRLRARLRYMRSRVPTRLIIVDYLQLMRGTGKYERRDLEVSALTRDLKILAKTEQVCVVALCQLNRGPEHRADKRPALADLRESGAIEQDADTVILLHREDAYEPESPRAGEIDLIVAKNRSGPQFVATCAFQGHFSRIVDMAADR